LSSQKISSPGFEPWNRYTFGFGKKTGDRGIREDAGRDAKGAQLTTPRFGRGKGRDVPKSWGIAKGGTISRNAVKKRKRAFTFSAPRSAGGTKSQAYVCGNS